jgi:divalent metal cation (Fe/Co/Zn/Cd) transporter
MFTVCVQTGSMVVLVSTLDSALDILSGGILFLTALLASKPDPVK